MFLHHQCTGGCFREEYRKACDCNLSIHVDYRYLMLVTRCELSFVSHCISPPATPLKKGQIVKKALISLKKWSTALQMQRHITAHLKEEEGGGAPCRVSLKGFKDQSRCRSRQPHCSECVKLSSLSGMNVQSQWAELYLHRHVLCLRKKMKPLT